MRRTFIIAVTLLICGAVAAPTTATAATAPVVVQVADRPIRLDADRTADVVSWVKCQSGLQAFEVNVSVQQRDRFGSTSITQANIVPCDGARHRVVVNVADENGANFHAGQAWISVGVQVYDPEEGGDSGTYDDANVVLKRPVS